MPELITTIPSILHVSPTSIDPSTSVRPEIQITFSTDMMVSSLNNDTLINRLFNLIETDTDNLITLEYVRYTSSSKTLVVKPTEDLSPGKNYQLSSGTPKDAALSLGGRSLSSSKIFNIAIGSYVYPTPITVLPGNGSVLSSVPTYNVFVAPYSSPSGDIVFLDFQFSDTGYFSANPFLTTLSQPLTGGVLNYLCQPSIAYTTGKTYWWRTRIRSSSATSEWSEVSNFLFDTSPLITPILDNLTSPISDDSILSITSAFDSGSSNLSSWPDLTFTSSFPLAYQLSPPTGFWVGPTGQMHVYGQPVDGQTGYIPVAGSWTFYSATGFAFIPESMMATNIRYVVVFDQSIKSLSPPYYTIGNDLNFKFSGRYIPLYAWPVQMRAMFGNYVSNMSDDLLCYHLYRASLEANRYTRLFPTVSIDPGIFMNTPTIGNLQLNTYNDVYSIHMFTMYKAMEFILQMGIFETITCADGSTKIGDFSQNMTSSNVLRFMRDTLKDITQKRAEYELLFSRKSGRPRTPIKASSYPSDKMPLADWGYGVRRDSF
jgi:hypothetical protein